jgi:hypothetical protein
MMQYFAVLLGLFPVVGSAGPTQLLATSLGCGAALPFDELAALGSLIRGVHVTPANPDCVAPATADFFVEGVSETELVAMLLRWEFDVLYAGYQINAITAVAVNDAKVGGVVPSRAFLTARQISAPMGVALAAFAVSGIAAITLSVSGSARKERLPGPATCFVVLADANGFY